MAIYHLRLKVVSRGLGRAAKPGGALQRSAVAAAAYRSGERLYDSNQGKWFAFDKPDVVHTEILIPDQVAAPAWVTNRQTLWNMVERSEKRKDAQLAREVEITLPRELSRDQQIALVRSFARDKFVRLGMVADIAIHEPVGSDGMKQPHAHLQLTLRRLDSQSETGFAKTKAREWNEPEAIALGLAEARKRFNDTGLPEDKAALDIWEARRNVNVWRAAWAEYANRSLEEAGAEDRIDHRTLEAQGIARKPQPHLGVARHIEQAYAYLKERLTHWVAIQKRTSLYRDVLQYQRRDPVKMAEFLLRVSDMAEDLASRFKRPNPIPEVDLDR